MNGIIIYGSCYGTTKSYAEKLSELTQIPTISYKDIKDLSDYDTVIHLGGLYAGGVLGLKETVQALSVDTRFIIATVGLAAPEDSRNIENICNNLKRQIKEELYEKTQIFHLRGGIDYTELSFKHKTMMKMLYMAVKSKPAEEIDAETKGFLETYNQTVDFVDYNCLNQIIEMIE